MNRKVKVLAFFISCMAAVTQSAWAQHAIRFQETAGPAVRVQDQILPMPWAGGFNSPQFSAIDLNHDGQQDLFVFDRSSRRVTTFLAVQTNGQWAYQHAPAYEKAFPKELQVFALLRDYDRDGAPDLFTASNLGMKVYRNTSGTGTPTFDLTHPVLFYNIDVNLVVGAEDLPAITDMEKDGDLDLLLWEWSGGLRLEYFQNMQQEQNLPAAQMKFTKASSNWGDVSRCIGSCNKYAFNGDSCPAVQHIGGSSVLPLDVDANGVLDLVVGHDDCPDLVSLMNIGSNLQPRISSAQYNLPPDITGNQFSVFPAAYYLDVTFDGIPDLVVAPNATSNSHQNVNLASSTWVYANTGTAILPRFTGAKQPFLQHQMVDLGEGAAPALGALTGGNTLDLLVGNTALLNGTQYAASLTLFQNKGTGSQPQFELVNTDYLGFASQKLLNLKPQLVDLNQDGAIDLAYSAYNPATTTQEFHYLLNQAAAQQPAQFSAAAVRLTGVTFTRGDTPYLYDVDQNGTLDLLVGRSSGALHYYRNTGTSTSPVWALVSDALGGLAANSVKRRLQLHIAHLDQNTIPDLLTTDDSGQLNLYPDFTAQLSGTFPVQENVLWDELQFDYKPALLGPGNFITSGNLQQLVNARPTVILGTHAGGLKHWQVLSHPLSARDQELAKQVLVFPNPAQGFVQVQTPQAATLQLFTLTGTKVLQDKTASQETQQLDVQHLPDGFYLLRVTLPSGQTSTHKLLLQR
ncbi:T9SS type A sorting domain-containing protein [Rufibacter sp. LB8]|uniref:T9SS type A sorting domain-containing protein n=1 Tax=Rufibacter sp. LB8 TaxID=2777781 RepID=UPI00178C7156|nr:T9SS type A sorting domain-containing protein [Rufibacter sp. LB8]